MSDIRKLAEYLGLSVGTVSRALNDRPEVSPKTRKRVVEAARKIGYVPNQAGRSLRQGATRIFGFAVDSADTNSQNSAVFFFEVVQGIHAELEQNDLDLILFPGYRGDDLDAYLRSVSQRHIVDGVIVCVISVREGRARFIFERGDTLAPADAAARSEPDYLEIDFARMVSDSVERLHAKGHSKIAFSVPDWVLQSEPSGYMKHFRGKMEALGLVLNPDHILAFEPGCQCGYETAARIVAMPDPPTALICMDGEMMPALYNGLTGAGWSPGPDLAILTVFRKPFKRLLTPRVSGYAADLHGLGRVVGARLLAGVPEYASRYLDDPSGKSWWLTYVDGETDKYGPREKLPRS